MIDQKRNERFWTKGCGWKLQSGWWQPPIGVRVQSLPSPSDLSFIGYLLRDALPKVREKLGDCTLTFIFEKEQPNWVQFGEFDEQRTIIYAEEDALYEALFNACEKTLGLEEK